MLSKHKRNQLYKRRQLSNNKKRFLTILSIKKEVDHLIKSNYSFNKCMTKLKMKMLNKARMF